MRDYENGRPSNVEQRAWAENELRRHGHYRNYDAIYRDGITRLPAIIFKLRAEGWRIETKGRGKLADFVVSGPIVERVPGGHHVTMFVPLHRCAVCHNPMDLKPSPLSLDVLTGQCILTNGCVKRGVQTFYRLSS